MDRFRNYSVFSCVCEKMSFSKAAEELGLPNATVSTTVQELESQLGVKLLNRTTRHVSLTPEGVSFLEKCQQLLSDVADAEAMFRNESTEIKGKVRVDMTVSLADHFVLPRLNQFLEKYPHINIELSSKDYYVDLMREGIDCVIRSDGPIESQLVAKQLTKLECGNFASPGYLKKYGKPKTLEDLKQHSIIHYAQNFGSKVNGFEVFDGSKCKYIKMKSRIAVNSTIAYRQACADGLGIAQIPKNGVVDLIKQGQLIEILPKFNAAPYYLQLIYHERRILNKSVRVFMEWLTEIFKSEL